MRDQRLRQRILHIFAAIGIGILLCAAVTLSFIAIDGQARRQSTSLRP